ncbi:MAG TPA: ROK family protein [Candidatus Saccharimonadales bacterium]|nr:ROK family protein [Candidatus Saccharimonadales bacterium]
MTKSGDKGVGLYLGIEIGGTKLQVCVGHGDGRIAERLRFAVDPASGAAGIRGQLEKTIPALARRVQPGAAGVGFGGPVDWTRGRICRSHQIEGWPDFPLGEWLGDLAGAPVRVENDANLGALGEASRGAGAGFKTVFYVTLGSGVGGGMVIDGQIYHGATPGEGEIGHVRLDRSGATLESRCSGWAVDARIRAAKVSHPASALAKAVGGAPANEAKFLRAALAANDPIAWEILHDTADDLAFGLSHVAHLFHPEIIVLGGGLALVGEPLRKAVAESLSRYVMDVFAPGPKIALARLQEDAVPSGALLLAAPNGLS